MYDDNAPIEYNQDLARTLCQEMDFKNLNWGDWFIILTALKSLGFSENEVRRMCEGSDKYNASKFTSQWNAAKENYTIETIIGKAKIYAPNFDYKEFKKQWYKDNPQFSHNYKGVGKPARRSEKKAAPMKEQTKEQPKEEIENTPAFEPIYLELTQKDIKLSRGNLHDFLSTCKDNKLRGLIFNTLDFFGCGFIEKWLHPKTRAEVALGIYKNKDGTPKNPPPPSRRLIIPTIDGNHYNAVLLNEDRTENNSAYWKQHAGEKPTFGLQTLNIENKVVFAVEGEFDCMSIWQAFNKKYLIMTKWGFIASLGLHATKWRDDLNNFFASRAEKPVVIWIGDGDHKDEDEKHRQALLQLGFPAFVCYFSNENKKYDANDFLINEGDKKLLEKIQGFLNDAENNLDAVKAEIEQVQAARADEEKIKQLISLPLSDMDNARRIQLIFGDRIRYNTTNELWGFYENGVWKFETSANSALYPYAAEIADIIKDNIPPTDEENNRASFAESLARSWTKNRIQRNAIEMVKGVRQMLITQKELDAHPNLINCKNNVVVDLRTGKYFPASPTFYLTQQAGANYNAEWKENPDHTVEKFLREILPNDDYRNCLLMWFACNLTGEVNEEKFLFIKGLGGNGKGTLTKILLKMFGDYGCSFPIGGILYRRNYDANAATTAINILENKRAAFGEEIPPNAKTDPAQIKILTGGDIVPARKNYSEYRNVNPTWKITFSGNNDLQFPDANDYGIKRRLILIPFEQDFTQNPNLKLKAELLEQENIDYLFNKLVRLSPVWYAEGLYIPQTLKTVADDYLKSQDFIADFISEYCERRADGFISRKDFVEKLREVYPRETPYSQRNLTEMLEKIDGVEYTRNNKGNILKGIDWK